MNTEIESCPICYDEITEKNSCITECSHRFCLKCLLTAVSYNNECPCCRKILKEEPENSIATNEDDEDSLIYGTDYSLDDDDLINNEDEASADRINREFLEKGLTYLDLVSLLCRRLSTIEGKNTIEYFADIENKYFDAFIFADRETEDEFAERQMMSLEDKYEEPEDDDTEEEPEYDPEMSEAADILLSLSAPTETP
jgi:hypothetical protein